MTNRSALDTVVDIEHRYPVDRWTVDGLHVWPLLRIRMYYTALFDSLGTGEKGAGRRSPGRRVLDAARGTLNLLASLKGSASPKPGKVAILLSDGVSLAKIEDEWFDRLMDPIVAAFAEGGMESFLMTPGTLKAIPRHTPSMSVQPWLDASKALSLVAAKLPRSAPECALEGLEDALAQVSARHPHLAFPDRKWLVEQAARVQCMAHFYRRVIARTGARVAFTSNYYGAEGMAFVLAARRAGCIVVDVQHGLQVDHVGYACWTKVPEGDYALLPHRFWCWSDAELAVINGTMASPSHRAVCVGNQWSDMWESRGIPMIARTVDRFRTIRDGFGKRRHFLLSPTWGNPDAAFDTLFDAVQLADDDIQWWLRLHPQMVSRREEFQRRLAARGIANVEIGAAIDFALPLVLSGMDVNITFDSSTVLDALYAGVPSVVTTENGASNFREQIEQGVAIFAQEPAEILAAAIRLADDNPVPAVHGSVLSAGSRMKDAIAQLLLAVETENHG